MYDKFAMTSNVRRFLAGVEELERRGSKEACWMIAAGEPGLGKTRTLQWWAIQHKALYLRAKSNWRPHWLLSELVSDLGESPAHSTAALFSQALAAIARAQCPLVIDEARNMLHDARLFETIRDLTDLTETPFVLGGEDMVLGRIAARFPQIASRISEVVRFEAATLKDVEVMCKELSKVEIAADVYPLILQQSEGYFREVKNAIGKVEAVGERHKGKAVTAAELAGAKLCRNRRDGRARAQGAR